MTSHLESLRLKLEARIRATRKARDQIATAGCEHTWQRFRQSVPVTYSQFHGSAYFVVNGCTKCHDKVVIDYVVEAA